MSGLLFLPLRTLGQLEPNIYIQSCYEIKEHLHSNAVQALAGGVISADLHSKKSQPTEDDLNPLTSWIFPHSPTQVPH